MALLLDFSPGAPLNARTAGLLGYVAVGTTAVLAPYFSSLYEVGFFTESVWVWLVRATRTLDRTAPRIGGAPTFTALQAMVFASSDVATATATRVVRVLR